MLLSELVQQKKQEAPGRLALVSFSSQDSFGVASGAEHRDLPLAAPGGYCYRPAEGQQLAVLDTQDGAICVGAVTDGRVLSPGEIKITGPMGSCIHFRPDGTILVNGQGFPPPTNP